jgi:hypothetical protein
LPLAAVIFLIAFAMTVVFVFVLKPALIRRIHAWVAENGPSVEEFAFVRAMCEWAFAHPSAVYSCIDEGRLDAVLRMMWRRNADRVSRVTKREFVNADELTASVHPVLDGRTAVLVQMPMHERVRGIYWAIILPPRLAVQADERAAATRVRLMELRRCGSRERPAELNGYVSPKDHRTFNVGAPIEPHKFLMAALEKLRELKL